MDQKQCFSNPVKQIKKQTNCHRGDSLKKIKLKNYVRTVMWTITVQMCTSFSVNIQYNKEQDGKKDGMVYNI